MFLVMGLELLCLLGIFFVGPLPGGLGCLGVALCLLVLGTSKGFLTSYFLMDSSLSVLLLGLSLCLSMWCLADVSSVGLQVSVLGLLFCLMCSFLSVSVIWFYLFYEVSLLPIVIIVTLWGYQPERLISGVYMLFYTLAASLPLLWAILTFKGPESTCDAGGLLGGLIMVSFSLSFFVNMPAYGMHLWLPLAHVEAPKVGSMLLAGLLLNLSCYGFYLFWGFIAVNLFWSLVIFFMYGGVIASFVTLSQVDINALVAYSSVVHICWCPIFCLFPTSSSLLGLALLGIGHGLTSSGMFFVCTLVYERAHTRSLLVLQGSVLVLPGLVGLIGALLIISCSMPPFTSWVGEVIFGSQIAFNNWVSLVLLFGLVFLGIGFSLLLFSNMVSSHSPDLLSSKLVSFKEIGLSLFFILFQPLGLMVLTYF